MLPAWLLDYAWTRTTQAVKHWNGLNSISVFLESIMGKSVMDFTIVHHRLDRCAYLVGYLPSLAI